MNTIHFLRPAWLLCFLPLIITYYYWLKKPHQLKTWQRICDPHLLPHLIQTQTQKNKKRIPLAFISLALFILSLSGPAFVKLPVPIFKQQQARVIILDLSNTMLMEDIKPNRLKRAKFKLHDLFQQKKHSTGQFGLIVYSGEPFIVAPLTEDTHTIDMLLDALSEDIMPVGGNRLDIALLEAQTLIQQAGFKTGEVLVMSGEVPTAVAIKTAQSLAKNNITTSILPLRPNKALPEHFKTLAQAGQGHLYPFTITSHDILSWQAEAHTSPTHALDKDAFPLWRDDGRWLLIPALLCMLPLFRKNYFAGEGV